MLFNDVKAYFPETFPHARRSQLTQAIERNGGHVVQLHAASHVITNSYRFQGSEDVQDAHIVADSWVDRSMILGEILPFEFYSADPSKIFSGVVACGSGIPAKDLSTMEAGVRALGGQWRHGLTKDVTHLFATSRDSEKYAVAMTYQKTTQIIVLLPHWFDDVVRLGGRLPTTAYEWPDPKLLHAPPSEKTERNPQKLNADQRLFFRTAIWNPDRSEYFPGPEEPAGDEVWGGRTILLSGTLGLDDEKRWAIEEAIKAAGGVILPHARNSEESGDQEEFERVDGCDVFITRWRAGKAYIKAIQENKVVGSLNWLFYVHGSGTLTSSMDKLLHFPIRKGPVLEGFLKQEITVTNYTGEARDYLKALIHAMGARFTPSMSGSNTILIAAHMGGIKTTKALAWSIPVVNHVWLEDCFVEWRYISPATHKYITFPPNVDFAPMLGDRGLLDSVEDLLAQAESEKPSSERPPLGTEASAKEVERILEDGDECASPVRRLNSDEVRIVSASVSPSKHRSADEKLDSPPKPSTRRAQVSKAIPTRPVKQAEPARGKGNAPRALVDDHEEEEEIAMVKNANVQKKNPPKGSGKVTFSGDSAGPSKLPTSTSKRKAPASHEDEPESEESDSPPPPKRPRSGKTIAATTTSSSATVAVSSSSGKRKRTAGTDRDSPPRKLVRTESVRAAASERPGPKKVGSAKQSGPMKKSTRTEVKEDSDEVTHPRTERSRDKAAKNDDKDASNEIPPPKLSKPKSKKDTTTTNISSSSRKTTSTIKIMTTGTTLPDPVLKALAKLGAKTTVQISECTHLIASGIVRTQKFLCALAAGALILSDKWATDSVAANKLLPEQDYILSDKTNERKWKFRLEDAMRRANEIGGKLFEQKSFYVTPKTPVDAKLLKSIVTAQGGKLVVQAPTMRVMNSAPDRYIISCPEDVSIWRPLTEHHTVYSHELLLMAALTQQIDWENPEFQIEEEEDSG